MAADGLLTEDDVSQSGRMLCAEPLPAAAADARSFDATEAAFQQAQMWKEVERMRHEVSCLRRHVERMERLFSAAIHCTQPFALPVAPARSGPLL